MYLCDCWRLYCLVQKRIENGTNSLGRMRFSQLLFSSLILSCPEHVFGHFDTNRSRESVCVCFVYRILCVNTSKHTIGCNRVRQSNIVVVKWFWTDNMVMAIANIDHIPNGQKKKKYQNSRRDSFDIYGAGIEQMKWLTTHLTEWGNEKWKSTAHH